ncbi:MAG: qgdA [Pedosphaera sp.]|nr:qgdA [Pedosphaera sp.]
MTRAAKVIFLLLICAIFAGVTEGADWYRWRGPDLNGISTETGWQTQWPAEGPKQLWKASVGAGFSSMSVSQGRVYTMGNDGDATDTVWCLDAATGAPVWKHSYPCPLDPKYYEGGTSSTPTVDGDRVYTISRKGDLFCLDAAKGKVVWSKNIPADLGSEIPTWGFAGSPLVEGDLLILNAGSAGLALNKKTGAVIWHSGNGPAGYSTPVPFNSGANHFLAFAASQTIEAINPADGKSVWSFPWKTLYDVNAADPIFHDGKMFVSSGCGHGCVLLDISAGKPTVVWENKEFRNHINSSVLWQGYLYGVDDVSNSHYELKCLSWDTGTVKWSEPKFGKGSLIIADGKIIGLSDKGELYVAEPTPAGFKPISHAQVLGGKCWTTPVLSNGRIYCRNAKGDLVCLDVSGKP